MYYFIYPNKDTYIYELNTNSEKNFGGDDNLVLKKDVYGVGAGATLDGVSRVLLNFDLTELSNSIVNGEITSSQDAVSEFATPKYYLTLYENETSNLSPEYTLIAHSLSQSWEEGTGYKTQQPNSYDGASWENRNQNFDHLTWSFTGNTTGSNVDTGSRAIAGGGVWFTGSNYQSSQSFSHQSVDVRMDITNMVNNWLGGSNKIPNNGLILKWSGSQENSPLISGDINFVSRHGDAIYSPKIEVVWDNHTNDYTGTFEDYSQEFGEADGTFEYPDAPIDPITIDGTDDNYMFMIGLKKSYKETETPKFRVAARERYQTKTVVTTKTALENKIVPHGSGSYSIVDVETGKTIIPFCEYSLLSTDTVSNFFDLKLNTFITNRLYRIKLRLRLNDGRYRIFDKGFDFKVTS